MGPARVRNARQAYTGGAVQGGTCNRTQRAETGLASPKHGAAVMRGRFVAAASALAPPAQGKVALHRVGARSAAASSARGPVEADTAARSRSAKAVPRTRGAARTGDIDIEGGRAYQKVGSK